VSKAISVAMAMAAMARRRKVSSRRV